MSRNKKIRTSASFGQASQATSDRRQVISRTAGGFPADLTRVPVEDLVGNPENRRDLGDLQELADSLQQHGLRQPVSVISSDDFAAVFPQHKDAVRDAVFVVINGNRRLAAARMAGVPTLAVHVTELVDSAAVRIAVLVENIHRKDLAPLEEAEAVRELVAIYGSNAEVGRQLNKSRMWVGQRLALLDLKPELKDALRDGSLKIKDARRLGTLAPEEQEAEWERLVNPVYDSPSDSNGSGASPEGVNPVYDQEPKPHQSDEERSELPQEDSTGRNADSPGKGGSAKARKTDPPVGEKEGPVQLMLDLEWHGEAKTLARQIYERLQESLGAQSRDAVLDELKAYR